MDVSAATSPFAAASRILFDLHACRSWADLEKFTLEELHHLIRSERSSWTEFRHQGDVGYNQWSRDQEHLKPKFSPIIEKFIGKQHPGFAHLNPYEPWDHTYRLTDFTSQREFEKTELFNEGYLPTGCRYQITVQVHCSSFGLTAATFARMNHDFSDSDRELLDCLLPHFRLVTARLLREQRVREAYSETASAVNDAHPCFSFDRQFFLRDANAKGMSLLKSLPEFSGIMLPREILRAIGGQARGKETINTRVELNRRLYRITGFPSGNPLFRYISLELQDPNQFLTQRHETVRLTRRETEIASWAKQGKTNREIATILGVSPRTVGKHLEHVFEKLHIENRFGLMNHF